jgi:hypothetical protein
VEEGTGYGSPAPKVRGKTFAVIPTNKSPEPTRWACESISPNAMS